MRYRNLFLHATQCGVGGCYLCRLCTQWKAYLPKSIYDGFVDSIVGFNITASYDQMMSFTALNTDYLVEKAFKLMCGVFF